MMQEFKKLVKKFPRMRIIISMYVVDTGQMNPGFFSFNTFLNILYFKNWVMKGDQKLESFN